MAATLTRTTVPYFLDTTFNNYTKQEFVFNGMMQYTHWLFENGGDPLLIA